MLLVLIKTGIQRGEGNRYGMEVILRVSGLQHTVYQQSFSLAHMPGDRLMYSRG